MKFSDQYLLARMHTLLRIGTLPDAQEEEKGVSERALNLLKQLASEDSITAIRMRHYIPSDDVDHNI